MPAAHDIPPDPIVGIDLGTTNSLVAFVRAGAPEVLGDPTTPPAPGAPRGPSPPTSPVASTGEARRGLHASLPPLPRLEESSTPAPPSKSRAQSSNTPDPRTLLLPSVVRYSPDAQTVEAVGWPARDHAVEFPERTISSVKRLMGRSLRDTQQDLAHLSYTVVAGPNETARIAIVTSDAQELRLISPQEVSAVILRALRDRASAALQTQVRRAVITVPAYFDDAQRQATRDAARLAGLDTVRIVNEPTAAALAYGVGLHLDKPITLAVYDLGGGTFDISILRVTPPSPATAAVVSGDSSSPSAGEVADPPRRNVNALRRDRRGGSDMQARTHAQRPAPDPAFFEVLSTAGDTHLGGDDADHLLLALFLQDLQSQFNINAATNPSTRQSLRQFAEATKIRLSAHDTAQVRIDLGDNRIYDRTISRTEFESLIQGWADRTISRCKQALRDAKLAAPDIDTVVLVGGSTRIPLIRKLVANLFQREPYTALDPDLVVALGAAVQASILDGRTTSALLLDVLPLSLGIETIGGGVAKLIVRNQTVPARATEMFSTSVDGQTSIKLHILQGEREMVSDCRSLGTFHLSGLPPMPAGVPQIEVEFLVDANGILNVSAHERRSGKRAALQVIPNHGLTREEVDRIESESLTHAREDMTRHRIADLIVNARMDIKWTRDALARVQSKLDPAYLADLEQSLTALADLAARAEKDWKSVDPNAFHHAKESLDKTSMRLHETAISESLRGA